MPHTNALYCTVIRSLAALTSAGARKIVLGASFSLGPTLPLPSPSIPLPLLSPPVASPLVPPLEVGP